MHIVCPTPDCTPNDCVELTDRELYVCATIRASEEPISFSEVKRNTHLHQEIVSRVIRRLSTHGLVMKVDGKYQSSCDC